MSAGETRPDQPQRGPFSDPPEDPALIELRGRLDALRRSVEQLGADGTHAWQSETVPGPVEYPGPAASAHDYQAYDYPAPAQAEDPGQFEPEPQYEPAPAATNGQGDDAVAAQAAGSVALVDVGPFSDLVELRRFEDELAAMDVVRDVRVCRVAGGRAEIEVGMAGPYAIGRELQRLGRPVQVAPGGDGQLIVELIGAADPPEGRI